MNHHVTLTPSQRARHDAAKAREADRVRKAMRLKAVAPAPKPIEPPAEKPKPRLIQVAPAGQIIPLHFNTFKTISISWVGEYCPYAGGSVELARDRSMTEIAIEWLKRFPGVTMVEIKGSARARRIVFPRQIITFFIKHERQNISFPQIGRWMGGRDHTTCLTSYNKIKAMIDNGTFDAEVEEWHRMFGKARAE
ncbi:helix-turn-helix domain-containing protein [Agrobacterium pusense]|uniref:helix-turn-helix domain-containing protein n=1 Tax=Agrobacterium pusense TaxID=648995 RepID=UPI000D1B0BCE|nr:helix-turn-helix domain-containing protein [Agrobacterium pusense]